MSAGELIVVLPFCRRDYGLASSLLNWISRMGKCANHDLLLLADIKIGTEGVKQMKALADKAFRRVYASTTPRSLPDERWPLGPNWMFRTAVSQIRANFKGQPFYFLEPDCVPLKPDWIDQLDAEYRSCGKPFMGAVVHSSGKPDLPGDHLTGVAIYPHNAYEYLRPTFQDDRAFDIAHAHIVLPHTHHTRKHFHLWGHQGMRIDSTTFIPPDAVILHQCKDGSLIKLLSQNSI